MTAGLPNSVACVRPKTLQLPAGAYATPPEGPFPNLFLCVDHSIKAALQHGQKKAKQLSTHPRGT